MTAFTNQHERIEQLMIERDALAVTVAARDRCAAASRAVEAELARCRAANVYDGSAHNPQGGK